MKTYPELLTKRLILNQPLETDRENLLLYLNQTPEFSENTLSMPYPYTNESADFWFKMANEGFEKKDAFIFAIREKENSQLLGGIGLHLTLSHHKAEVGYWIAKPFWNKGYVTEALKTVLDFGFKELHLNKIFAVHFLHNPASGKVLQKCGMKQEAILKQEYFKNGKYFDVRRYSLLKEEWSD